MRVQNFEHYSIKEAQNLARKDGGSEYAELNYVNYYVCINTWVNLCESYNIRFAHVLACYINQYGLKETISMCSKSADLFVQSDAIIKDDVAISLTTGLGIKDTLQVLRFPKRFSVTDEELANTCLQDFLSFNNAMKMKERYELPYWITSHVKSILTHVLRRYNGHSYVSNCTTDDGSFSNGACVGARTLADKLRTWDYPNYLDISYPIDSCGESLSYDYSECVPVPKNYKCYRIIGMEFSRRQYEMFSMRIALIKAIDKRRCNIDFTNQSQNQVACYLSSINPEQYATIDLSSASDSISMSHIETCFPAKVWEDVREIRSPKIRVGNKYVTSYIALTSGTNITFPIETLLFWGIATACTEYVSTLTHKTYQKPIVYGDDILCDVAVYDSLVDWLTLMHFSVNVEKSFGSGLYRESCGVEAYNGDEVDIVYYPRKPITKTPESFAALCQLQHRLYEYYQCQRFLVSYIRDNIHGMTSHLPLTACDDLWEPVPFFRKWRAPVAKDDQDITYTDEVLLREGHYVLTRKRPHSPISVCDSNLDMYYYVQYLKFGPMYASPLDELLGVTTSRCDYWRDCSAPDMVWKLQAE